MQPDGRWRYTVRTTHPAGPGTRIEAEARDHAGNVTAAALVQ